MYNDDDGGYGSCYEHGFGGFGSPTHVQPGIRVPKWEFYTEEELITSSVFQRCLGQALAHKDREIDSLRKELMKPYWARD